LRLGRGDLDLRLARVEVRQHRPGAHAVADLDVDRGNAARGLEADIGLVRGSVPSNITCGCQLARVARTTLTVGGRDALSAAVLATAARSRATASCPFIAALTRMPIQPASAGVAADGFMVRSSSVSRCGRKFPNRLKKWSRDAREPRRRDSKSPSGPDPFWSGSLESRTSRNRRESFVAVFVRRPRKFRGASSSARRRDRRRRARCRLPARARIR
jgi:hypothetical protein